MKKFPNIVFIMSDQHNAKCLGVTGHPLVKTPNLDKLAQSGVWLTSAYTQNPICTPSRVSFLSGQYPHNHGYFGLAGPKPAQLPSIFSALKGQGYCTGAIGKIHTPHDWIEPNIDCLVSPGARLVQGLKNVPCYHEFQAGGRHRLTAGQLQQEAWMKTIPPQGYDGFPHFLPKELSPEAYLVTAAQQFLDQQTSTRPFFLWFSIQKPHQAYVPAQEFWDLYPDDVPLPPNFEAGGVGKIAPLRETAQDARLHPPAQQEPADYVALCHRKLRGYYGNISHMDWCVGQLLQALEERGLREDTIIVYSSDHGDFACEHGLLEKAPGISSDAIGRIPMIWSWPGHLPQNTQRQGLAQAVDMWPTLAALAGLETRAMWDGKDLSPLLLQGSEVHSAVFTENPWLKCVTTTAWRMTVVPEGVFPDDAVRGELYDRAKDPWEINNLYHSPHHQKVVSELKEVLYAWLVTTLRPVTAHPVAAHPSLQEPVFHGAGCLPEDGKTAPAQMAIVMQAGARHHLNYL